MNIYQNNDRPYGIRGKAYSKIKEIKICLDIKREINSLNLLDINLIELI